MCGQRVHRPAVSYGLALGDAGAFAEQSVSDLLYRDGADVPGLYPFRGLPVFYNGRGTPHGRPDRIGHAP